MPILILLLISTAAAWAQVPLVSNIKIDSISHASVRVVATADVPVFWQVSYGTQPGVYPYASASHGPLTYTSMALGGLQPATTYYFRIKARPNKDDDTNICEIDTCGSIEQVVTTLPEPAIHPEPARTAVNWMEKEGVTSAGPDTSGYTIVTMEEVGGVCQVASDVSDPGDWRAGGLTAGDSFAAVLATIYYGTEVRFPHGHTCKVSDADSAHRSYILPTLTPQTPTQKWIVIRGYSSTATDLPPDGFRTDPNQWNLFTFEMQDPGEAPDHGDNQSGQLFDTVDETTQYWWFEDFNVSTPTCAPDEADPHTYAYMFRTGPFNGSPSKANHIVFNQVAISTPDHCRIRGGMIMGGEQIAVLNSYFELDMWRPASWSIPDSTAGSGTITVPRGSFKLNASDSLTAMSADSVLSFSGTGTMSCWMDAASPGSNALTCEYSGITGVSCDNCSVSAGSETIPPTAIRRFTATISAGTPTITSNSPDSGGFHKSNYFNIWAPAGIFVQGGDSKVISNNFIQAIGQTVYIEESANRTFDDHIFTHNHLYFPRQKMGAHTSWDGFDYTYRNPFEAKQGVRWKVEGNIIDGAAAQQNAGQAIVVFSSFQGSVEIATGLAQGVRDFSIRNNLLRHLSAGFSCGGGGPQGPPDSAQAKRISVVNNLWLDLDQSQYSQTGVAPSFWSGYFNITSGCEDVIIRNNTGGLVRGRGPSILISGASAAGVATMGEGLDFSKNVLHLSDRDPLGPMWNQCDQIIPSHPAVPDILCNSEVSDYGGLLDSAFVRIGATVIPNYRFSENVFIGAERWTGSQWTDMSQGDVNAEKALFPKGNTFAPGSTLAARRTAVKWDPDRFQITSSPSNPGDRGADVAAVYAAAGIVQNVRIEPSATQLKFSYTAPDNKVCYVDTAPQGSGSWTRTADSGGSRARTINVIGLTASTNYEYRVMCYFPQTTAFEFLPDQVTTGTVSTTATVARNVWVAAPLSSISGAAKVRVTLAPIEGGSLLQTECTSSPCQMTAAGGLYQQQVEILDAGGVPLRPAQTNLLTIP